MIKIHNKRVIITGAAGFIGANLTRELIRREAEVNAIVRPGSNLWRIEEILPNLNLHKVDLTNRYRVKRTVDEVKPEIIFHLAAHGVYSNQKKHHKILRTNVIGTSNLLEATAELSYELFVHTGGSSEYGKSWKPMKETDLLKPVTYYGATKAASTLLCLYFVRVYHKPIVVLRPFSVYGFWEAPTRLIPTAITSALHNREMFLTTTGYRRDFVFVEDVVDAYMLTLRAGDVSGEVINIGTGEQWSNEEVVDIIQVISGRKIQIAAGTYPARSSDTSHWVADIQKAKKLLGWKSGHTLRTGLEKTISWFRQHHDIYDVMGTEDSETSKNERN